MAESNLVLHCGARPATVDEVMAHRAPPPEGRWFPVSHGRVLTIVKESLRESGFNVTKEQFGLSHEARRFFGVLDLEAKLADGVTLAVGVRNSVDKSFPIGFAAGNRVFCCDNLAFRSELMLRRKHTRNGESRFVTDIASGVMQLTAFRITEEVRIGRMQTSEMSNRHAESLMLRAFEGIIGPRELPRVIREWREPSFEEFRPRTAWSLFNAGTTVLGEGASAQPQKHVVRTMRWNAMFQNN
jgi:hypothetical protein